MISHFGHVITENINIINITLPSKIDYIFDKWFIENKIHQCIIENNNDNIDYFDEIVELTLSKLKYVNEDDPYIFENILIKEEIKFYSPQTDILIFIIHLKKYNQINPFTCQYFYSSTCGDSFYELKDVPLEYLQFII